MAGIKDKATWCDIPYIAYLDAVDVALETKCGRTSTQKELEAIAHMQEADCDPLNAALSLVGDGSSSCDAGRVQPCRHSH